MAQATRATHVTQARDNSLKEDIQRRKKRIVSILKLPENNIFDMYNDEKFINFMYNIMFSYASSSSPKSHDKTYDNIQLYIYDERYKDYAINVYNIYKKIYGDAKTLSSMIGTHNKKMWYYEKYDLKDKNNALYNMLKDRHEGLIKCIENEHITEEEKVLFNKMIEVEKEPENKTDEEIAKSCNSLRYGNTYFEANSCTDFPVDKLLPLTIKDGLTEDVLRTGLPYEERQPVFSPKEYATIYDNCRNIFISRDVTYSKTRDACNSLVEWSQLLNNLFTLCHSYSKANFIRFVLPEQFIHPYWKYASSKEQHEIIGVLKIIFNDDRTKLTELRSIYPYCNISKKCYFFIYILKTKQPIHHILHTTYSDIMLVDSLNRRIHASGVLFANSITYTEFNLFCCYLNLPIYRSIDHKPILFIDHHKKQYTEDQLNIIGIEKIEYECLYDLLLAEKKIHLKDDERIFVISTKDLETYDIIKDGLIIKLVKKDPSNNKIDITDLYTKKYIILKDNISNKQLYNQNIYNKILEFGETIYVSASPLPKSIIKYFEDRHNTKKYKLTHMGGSLDIKYIDTFVMSDPKIVSEYYQPYADIERKYYVYLKEKHHGDRVYPAKFSLYLNKYEFILPQSIVNIQKYIYKVVYDKMYLKPNIINPDTPYISIIKYIPFTPLFFHGYEILHNFIKTNIGNSVLEIAAYPTLLESINFYQKKYYNAPSKYNLLFMEYYNNEDDNNKKNMINHMKQNIDMSVAIYKNKITKDFFETTEKYDLICSTLLSLVKRIIFIDHASVDIQLAILIYIIGHLNINGSAIVYLNQIRTPIYAELLQFYQDNFKQIILYEPEVHNLYKHSGTFLIAKKFKGPVNYEQIKKLFIENPPKFTINDKTVYDLYVNTPDDPFNPIGTYISSFNKHVSSELLDYINEYNKEQYLIKYLHTSKLYNLAKMPEDKQIKFIKKNKEKQLIDATLYAQKYDLPYISYGSKILSKELETKILSEIYSYSLPIIYNFKTESHIKNSIPISSKLAEFKRRILITNQIVETRNIYRWLHIKKITRLYTPLNKELHLLSFVQKRFDIGPASQAWLKMYEMIMDLKLFKDKPTLTTFHLQETGDFPSAINHYIKTMRPNTKVSWSFQNSLSPKTIDNYYGYITKYADRWDKTDVTDPENLKHFQNIISKVDFVTSDYGSIYKGVELLESLYVHVCHLVAILTGLSKDKSFVAKFMMPVYHPIQISLIYTIFKSFKKTVVYKGVVNQYSTEFYIVGKKFTGLDSDIKQKLETLINNKFDENTDIYDNSYDEAFMNQLVLGFDNLVNNYIVNFDKQLYYVDNYDELKDKNYDDLIVEKNNEWIKRMKIHKIDKKDRL